MSTSGKVRLTVIARDRAAEIFVIDSRLDRVDRGVGMVTTHQPPGVYKIKVRAGQATHEELVVLEKAPVERVLEQLNIPSAMPLDQTAQSHGYHQEAALRESRTPRVRLGRGASIFVFARDWTPQGEPPVSGHHPAEKLELCSAAGEVVVNFQEQSAVDLEQDPWAACRVEVEPGLCRLRVTAGTGQAYESAVIAQAGWQTQVFLLQRRDPLSPRGRRPDLAGASVTMSHSHEFSQDAGDSRLAELARLALVDGRALAGKELSQMLRGKFQNPMLGIFGGHLLLRQPKPDRSLLRIVTGNLRAVMGGAPHPDVEALALAAGIRPRGGFAMPPMLRASWRIVVERSIAEPGLVPEGSLGARIGTLVTNQDPWLIWRTPAETDTWAEAYLDDFRELLERDRKEQRQSSDEQYLAGWPGIPAAASRLAAKLSLPPSTVTHLIAQATHNLPMARGLAKGPGRRRGKA